MIMKPKWMVTIAFWIIFLLSIGLSERYQWIGLVWCGVLWLLVLATFINFVSNLIHHHGDKRIFAISHHGWPRWFIRFACDQDEQTEKRRVGDDTLMKEREH